MAYLYRWLICIGLFIFSGSSYGQCPSCTATTFNVNLSASTDTSWTVSSTRNGDCCTGTNCVRFNVTLNPASDLLSFDVTNPSPSGSAFYQIDCGPAISIGTPACITGLTTVCITYCKPGGDNPTYHITSTRTVQGSGDITVRSGCPGTLSVTGLQTSTIQWTSIFPGAVGAYNSFLSCVSACATTNVTATAGAPPYIDYVVSGSPNTSCPGTSRDTIRVYVVPGMTVGITPANPVICSGGSGSVSLTATPSGGAPPYTYSWSNGTSTPTTSVSAAGTYSVAVSDGATSCPPIISSVYVAANPTPAAPLTNSNSPVCQGSTITINAETITGATYNWTGPNGFTSTLQSPTIPNASSANSGNYSVTVTVGGCTSPPSTVPITVNPIPLAPAPSSNSPVCETTTLALSATTVPGATYTWTGPNGFTSAVQNPSIPSASSATAGTYTVYSVVNGCSSLPATTIVTISPTPSAPAAGGSTSICAGSTLNLTASTITNASYSWTGPNGFSSSSQNPSIPSATTAATGTYSVSATVNGCTGPAGTTIVTVNPIPVAPVPTASSPVCAGSTITFTASTITNATYSWTGPNGFTSSLQNPTLPSATSAATGTYSVTATVNGCTGPAGTISVTVNPIPAAPAPSSNSPVCAGNTLSLSSTPSAGTYTWTGPNGFSSNLQNPSVPSATAGAAGTYTVRAVVNGCASAPATTVVTISPIPAAPEASSNSPVCAGNTVTLNATTVSGATYSWIGPNGFSASTQAASIPSATTAATGTYSVTATAGGCTGPAGTTVVTVNPIPATPSPSSNAPICQGQTLSLSTTGVAGAIYSWSGPNGFTSSLQNPTIAAASSAAAGTYSLVVTVAGCSSPAGTTAVVVNTTPAAPVASSNSPICAGSTLNLFASSTGATYSWTGPNGFTSTLQNPSIPSATTAASGTYSVTAATGTCIGPAGMVTVTVRPIPAAPVATASTPVCAGDNIILNSSLITNATYSWTGPNGFTSSLQNPTIVSATTAASGTYSVTATVNGCTGPAGTVAVTVNPIPSAPVASSNSPVCAGSTLNIFASNITNASYTWTGPNGFTSALQNPSVSSPTTLATGTFSVTATVNGCSSVVATTAVTVNPIPATPVANGASPVCVGNTLTLTSTAVAGASYSWTGPNGFTASTQNTSIPNVTAAAAGTYSLVVTVNGCSSSPGTRNIIINPIPAPPSSSGTTICSGNTATLTATGSGTFQWYSASTGGSLLSSTATYTTPVLNTNTTYYVQNTVGGCPSPRTAVTVTVNPTPVAPTSNGVTVCENSTATLTATAPGGTYDWFDVSSGGASLGSGSTFITGVLTATDTFYVQSTINGCTGPRKQVIVTVTPTDNSSFAYSTGTYCITGTNPTPVISGPFPGTFTSTPAGLSINASTGTITLSASALGTYVVSFTTSGPCPSTSTQNVTITNAPDASFSYVSPACKSGSNPTPVFPSGASAGSFSSTPAGLSFVNTSTGEIDLANTTAGTYTITNFIAPAGGCVAASASNSITIDPAPTVFAGNNISICNGSSASLSGTIGGTASSATWTGGTGTFSAPSSVNTTYTPGAADIANGSVTLYLTTNDPSGPCSSVTDSVVVSIKPIPASPSAAGQTICAGSTATITATAPAGTYTWYPTASLGTPIATGGTYTTPVLTITTTYYVTATVNGCESPATPVEIAVNPIPAAPVVQNDTICSGTTATLTATSPVGTYEWFDAITGGNQLGTGSTYTTPVLTASQSFYVQTTINGCTSPMSTVNVVVNPIPAAPTAGNPSICSGSSAILTATGPGGTYQWLDSPGGTVLSTGSTYTTPALTSTTTYYVRTTINGCQGPELMVTVTVNPIPSPPVANGITICEGSNGILTATSPGGLYKWFSTAAGGSPLYSGNPYTTPVLTSSTTYYVQTTINGCTSGRTPVVVSVTPADDPAFSYSSGTYCISGSNGIATVAGTTGGTFSSTPGGLALNASTGEITVSSSTPGTYTVVYTTNGSCPRTSSQTVTITTTPDATFSYNGPYCQYGNNPGPAFGPGASAGNFSSSPAGLVFLSSSSGVIDLDNSIPGTYNITNFIAASAGCASATFTSAVTIQPGAFANAGSDQTLCSGSAVTLNGSFGGTATSASWSGNGIFSPGNSSMSATYTGTASEFSTGAATLVLTTDDPSGTCQAATDTVIITYINDNVAFSYSSGTYCITGSNPMPVVTTGQPGSFSSTPAGLAFVNTSTGEINLAGSAIGTYSVMFVSSTACPDTAYASVTITNSPDATFSYTGPVCNTSANILPSFISGSSAGVFSSSGGLVFADNTTGEIDVASSTAGTYTITNFIAPAAGCASATYTSTIMIDPSAAVNAGADAVICEGSNVSLSGSFTGVATTATWSGGGGSFSPSNQAVSIYTPTPSEISAGSLMMILTTDDPAGTCSAAADTMIVTINPLPAAPAASNDTICEGSSALLQVINPTTGYDWYSSASGGSAIFSGPNFSTVVLTTSTTYYVQSVMNGCPSTTRTAVTVIVDPKDDATFSYSSGTLCTSGTNAIPVVNSGATGTFTSSPAGLVFANTTTGEINVSSSAVGQYTITFVTSGVCPDTAVAVINIVTTADATFSYNDPFCVNGANGSPVFPVGSTPGIFSSTAGLTFVSPVTGEIDVASSVPGTYAVTNFIAASGGCNASTYVDTVVINPAPTISISTTTPVVCSVSAIDLTSSVTNAGGIEWNTNGDGAFSDTLSLSTLYTPGNSDLTSGSVMIFASTTGNGSCTAVSDTLVITILEQPLADAGADTVHICQGTPDIQLNGLISGSTTTGMWTTSGTGIFTPSDTNLNATYLFSAADTSAGTVTLVLHSTNNSVCTEATDTLTVLIDPASYAFAGADLTICSDSLSVQLAGSVTGGTSQGIWTSSGNGVFSPSASDLNAAYIPDSSDVQAGTVTITLTATNACSPTSDSFILTITQPLSIQVTNDSIYVCQASNVTVSATLSDTVAVKWTTNGTGTFANDTLLSTTYTPSAADTASGEVVLIVQTTSANLCGNTSDTVHVFFNTNAIVNAGSDITICPATSSIQLSGSVSFGNAAWTTNGTGSFAPDDTTLNAVYSPSAADQQSPGFYLVLTSTSSCNATSDTLFVTVSNTSSVSINAPSRICSGETIALSAILPGSLGITWNTGGGGTFSPNDSALSVTYTPSATDVSTGSVQFLLTPDPTSGGCTVYGDTATVLIDSAPVASFTFTASCENTPVQFTSTSTGTISSYIWTFGNGDSSTVANPSETYTAPGTYTAILFVSTASGCTDTASQTITVYENPVALFSFSGTCSGEPVTFTNSSTSSFIVTTLWQFGDGNTSADFNTVHIYPAEGSYTVLLEMTSSTGCKDTMEQVVQITATPVASFTPSGGTYAEGEAIAFTNTSSSSSTWTWDFGGEGTSAEQNPSFTFNSDGNYVVLLTSTNSSCADTAAHTFVITKKSEESPIGLPTAFTPNGDGVNDVLYIRGGPFTEIHSQIYTEWGNLLFDSPDQNTGWDGTYKGAPQPAGKYIWVVRAVKKDGEEINVQQEVTIIR